TVLLQGFPSGKAYPSKEDDRFWAAALDLNMPVSVHVDLDRSGERAGPLFKYPQESEELMKKLTHDLVDQVSRFGPVRGNGSVVFVRPIRSLSQAANFLRRKSDWVDSLFSPGGRRPL